MMVIFMFRYLYNIVFLAVFLVTCPYYICHMWRRGRLFQAFGERLGLYSSDVKQKLASLKDPVWIHAVSVGEMMLATVLVRELRRNRPDFPVVITTTTSTGRQVGEKLVDANLVLLYNPVDFYFFVAQAFRCIKPSILVLMEQEIWANYLWQAEKHNAPVWLLNARLSDRSWNRFRRFRWLTEPVLKKLSFVAAQDRPDVRRLADAGFPAHAIFYVGSMKFDVAELASFDAGLSGQIRKAANWKDDEMILLGGSTHPGEERVLLEIFSDLKKQYPGLRLLLAPRHVERTRSVAQLCAECGFLAVRRSRLEPEKPPAAPIDVLLLDTTGELRSIYDLGTINFIGKSLVGKGGQNFIEAARAGRPVVVGPNMQNFSRLAEYFVRENALIQVKDRGELANIFTILLADAAKRRMAGQKAQDLFRENLGSGARSAEMILQYLASRA